MRLTLFSRLFLGYFLLLVLAAGMSVYTIMQLGRVKDVTRSIIMGDNVLVGLHKDLTDALLSETRYEKKYLIVQDQILYEGFLQSKSEFDRYLSEARLLSTSPEAEEALRKVADFQLIYFALFLEEMDYLRDGRNYSQAWYAGVKDQAVNDAINELLKIRTLSQQSILDKVRKLSEAGRQARAIAIGMSMAMLLVGVFLAVWITRSITRPLMVMQKKTKDIANGVFDADLKLQSLPEIGELARAFNTMCSKLREVDKMKSDFFALMSHELRTPLTSIREGTNLFLEGRCGEVTEKQKKLLTIISEESNRLIGLVNSVLDLSKLEAGMLTFNFTRTDLNPLITRVMNEVGPLAEAKRIRLEKRTTDLPPLSMDIERMLQVLRNLIGNALKFTPRGGTVSIFARIAEQAVVVSIVDTGPGIPLEHSATIFDKFHQVPGTGKLSGTGLGLAIVKHIIQVHGGTIWFQSKEGGGSAFSFQLPV